VADRIFLIILACLLPSLPPSFYPLTRSSLIVTDSGGQTCQREEQPLHVVPGQVDYRLIILDGSQCQPPPDWSEAEGKGSGNDKQKQPKASRS